MRKNIALLTFFIIIFFVAFSHAEKLKGTNDDDTLIVYATAGEPPIAQDYLNGGTGPNGETIRTDPDGEINDNTRTFFERHPIHHDRIKVWGYEGADTFKIWTFLSGKPHIVAEHVNNNQINWNGVAGENDEVYDHWVDYFSTVVIQDFNQDEGDTLEVRGPLYRTKNQNSGYI